MNMIPSRSPRRVAACAVAACALSLGLLLPTSASASVSHIFLRTFGAATSTPSNPYPLSGPDDVAIDEASHDIYVTDPGNHRIEKFNEAGELLFMFGKEVNATNHSNVCAADEVCQPGAEDTTSGAFIFPRSLAVDNSPGGDGDVYVCDIGDGRVKKFDSAGHIITAWGELGQEESSCQGVAVDPVTGDLYVIGGNAGLSVYSQSGLALFEEAALPANAEFTHSLGVDPEGDLYSAGGVFREPSEAGVGIFKTLASEVGAGKRVKHLEQIAGWVDYGLAVDPSNDDVFEDAGTDEANYNETEKAGQKINHYLSGCEEICEPADSFGFGDLHRAHGLAVDGSSHTVYAANTETGDVAVFPDVQPEDTTGPVEQVAETSATLTGTVEPANYGDKPITECYFEYGIDESYSDGKVPCEPDPSNASPFESPTIVRAVISGLTPLTALPPGTRYHYRLVAVNSATGTAVGADRTFTTTARPVIEGVSSSHVSATSADLEASVNPDGVDTTYYFEYGVSSAYGESTPLGDIGSSQTVQHIAVPVTGLQAGDTYHFRLIAKNALGTSTSEDQTFEFFPPSCPNSAVRQQTSSSYLPDCRAYELVSPANADGTLFYSGGPNAGSATSPSRFSFTGLYGAIPGANTIDTAGDLYVATRTDTGWVSRYVGLPGSQAGCMGGPPNDPLSHVNNLSPQFLTNSILTNPAMSEFLVWLDGTPGSCSLGSTDVNFELSPASNAPYVFNAEGSLLQRLPTDFPGESDTTETALRCPYSELEAAFPSCTSEVTASADLSHLFFSSNSTAFAPGGLTSPPGSAYDDDLATHTVELISLKPNGESIAQDPAFATTPPLRGGGAGGRVEVTGGAEEFLRFPAVSSDGSHVLISTATEGTSTCDRGSQSLPEPCPRYIEKPLHLYMRVGGGKLGVTYEIAENTATHEPAAVNFVSMTPDGSKVFFTSDEHLTAEDPEHVGAALYMWSESTDSVTLVSKGESEAPGAAGNTGDCHPVSVLQEDGVEGAPWTSSCGAVPISTYRYSWLTGGAGGNGFSDTSMSSNGDIYFLSPEQLEGAKGIPGQENLYDYQGGKAHYVATLKAQEKCTSTSYDGNVTLCTAEPILRIDVNSDDSHMAFVTASQLTSYNNAGHLEMYSYTPSSGALVCDSCNPDGRPATADVQASQDGLFMTNDGRTFFSTTESLVPQDTNEGPDVYEFVDGRPQLITPGTGTAGAGSSESLSASTEIPGLIGVSANGTDVYFSTFDSLIPEDHNGNFFKFYDARTDGGFPQPTPTPPCEAAEECHGTGTEAPQLPAQGTAASLTGGNASLKSHSHHHKKNHRKKQHKKAKQKRRDHRAGAKRGGKK